MNRAVLKAALALLATALAGGALGYALGYRAGTPDEPPNLALVSVTRRTLLDSLALPPEQRREIDSVLLASERQADRVLRTLRSDLTSLVRETRRDVRGRLNDEQRARFDSLLAHAGPVYPRTPLPPARMPERTVP